MDRIIEKTKSQRLMKYWPWLGVGCLVLAVGCWLVFGNHAATLRVNAADLTVSVHLMPLLPEKKPASQHDKRAIHSAKQGCRRACSGFGKGAAWH